MSASRPPRLSVGQEVVVRHTSHGYNLYVGLVGRVYGTFDYMGRQKVQIEYPPLVSSVHGGSWTPWPYETFVDFGEVEPA